MTDRTLEQMETDAHLHVPLADTLAMAAAEQADTSGYDATIWDGVFASQRQLGLDVLTLVQRVREVERELQRFNHEAGQVVGGIAMELMTARRAERERCAKEVCWQCAHGRFPIKAYATWIHQRGAGNEQDLKVGDVCKAARIWALPEVEA